MPPLTDISTLESHLWEAANILRGSPLDRADWKSYILPLLFFKRICDVWDEEYQEAVRAWEESSVELRSSVDDLLKSLEN
jgi:type I restriction enzyme M protein